MRDAAALGGMAMAVPVQAAPDHPDAELLRRCSIFHVACADLAVVNAKDDPTDDEIAPIVAAWDDPIDDIIDLPATTMEGLQSKAQAVIDIFVSGGVDRCTWETVEERAESHEMMAWRLAHEIIAMGRAGA